MQLFTNASTHQIFRQPSTCNLKDLRSLCNRDVGSEVNGCFHGSSESKVYIYKHVSGV